jgi:hypothetical protein
MYEFINCIFANTATEFRGFLSLHMEESGVTDDIILNIHTGFYVDNYSVKF